MTINLFGIAAKEQARRGGDPPAIEPFGYATSVALDGDGPHNRGLTRPQDTRHLNALVGRAAVKGIKGGLRNRNGACVLPGPVTEGVRAVAAEINPQD